MRKSDSLIFRTRRLKELSEGIDSSVQFMVVDRVFSWRRLILDEEASLYNLFSAIEQELIQAQKQVASF